MSAGRQSEPAPDPLVLSGRAPEEIGEGAETLRSHLGALRDEGRAARVAFVFSPLRSEYEGMGRDLPLSHSAFATQMQACETALSPLLGWSPEALLRERSQTPPLARLDVSQPVLFAVQTSLAQLWRSAGVQPDAVLGHSVGEIAAAASCGALSLADSARVAVTWGRSCRQMEGTGAMASLPLPAAAVAKRIGRRRGLSIAAVNAPSSTAVTGGQEPVQKLLAELAAEGVHGRSMGIAAPGHSAGMAPIHGTMTQELSGISPRPGAIPFYSSTSGGQHDAAGLDGAYWSGNLSRPVLFEAAVHALLRDGYAAFVEIGPRPLLRTAIEETAGPGDGSVDFSEVPSEETEAVLTDLVIGRAAAAIGQAPRTPVDPDLTFKDLGFDSAGAVGLRDVLNRLTGLSLHATVAFDHPTPRQLAAKLRRELEGGGGVAAAKPVTASAIDELDTAGLVQLALEDGRQPGGD